MTFNTPAEKSAALADHAARFAESLAVVESEPNPMVRAVKAACTIAAADVERFQIMAAPCRPARAMRHGGRSIALAVVVADGGRESVQVLRRDS